MRNPFLRQAALALVLSAAAPNFAQAKIYGLVVGVDEYESISDLAGAVNDANDIAGALNRAGAERVALLTNEKATRSNIINTYRDYVSMARPGDTIVFTYAGHGIQLPEALAGDEEDGKDESFALGGFGPDGRAAAERIRDNDIADLFHATPQNVRVLFVADSCHSGTMTRDIDRRGAIGATRNAGFFGDIEDDPLDDPDPATFQLEASDFPHVVFAAAAREHETTPEVRIEQQARGALSWSVARAIEGAIADENGVTSLKMFRSYVRENVRLYSDTRQTPDVTFSPNMADAPLIPLKNEPQQEPSQKPQGVGAQQVGGNAPQEPTQPAQEAAQDTPQGAVNEQPAEQQPSEQQPVQVVAADTAEAVNDALADEQTTAAPPAQQELAQTAPPVQETRPPALNELGPGPKLFIHGPQVTGAEEALGDTAQLVASAETAELVWYRDEGEVLDRLSADLLAKAETIQEVAQVAQKWRVVQALKRWAPLRAMEMSVQPDDGRHNIGEKISLTATPPGENWRYLTVVNIASGGQTQFMFPSPKFSREGRDVFPSMNPYVLGRARVQAPVGADHIIAIASSTRLTALHEALLRDTLNAEQLLALIHEHAGDANEARVGVLPIYTEQ